MPVTLVFEASFFSSKEVGYDMKSCISKVFKVPFVIRTTKERKHILIVSFY